MKNYYRAHNLKQIKQNISKKSSTYNVRKNMKKKETG